MKPPVAPFTETDRRHMSRCLTLARQGLGKTSPNPMVGAVLVRDGKVLGEGAHMKLGAPHAEVAAIVAAGNDCRGATLYVNLEPCCHHGRTPPCVQAIARSGIRRVIAAMEDPNPLVSGKGFGALRAAGVEAEVGLLERQARQLNEVFVTYHTKKRPFVIAKWAMTLDGRTSIDSGPSRWISHELSRQYVHQIRSQCDAILVGVGTVIQDNPQLTVRLKGYSGRQPTRIIVDGDLRSPLGARCFSRHRGGAPTILATTSMAPPERIRRAERAGHKVLQVRGRRRIVDLAHLCGRLYDEGISSVLCEGGRQIHTSLFREGLVDKVIVFVAPKLIGGQRPTSPLEDLGIGRMKEALALERIEIHHFRDDVCIEGHVKSAGAG